MDWGIWKPPRLQWCFKYFAPLAPTLPSPFSFSFIFNPTLRERKTRRFPRISILLLFIMIIETDTLRFNKKREREPLRLLSRIAFLMLSISLRLLSSHRWNRCLNWQAHGDARVHPWRVVRVEFGEFIRRNGVGCPQQHNCCYNKF